MTKKVTINTSNNVRTFTELNHSSNVLFKLSQRHEEGSFHTILASLVMRAFTFEAFLNHIGLEAADNWKEFERTSVLDKYTILCEKFEIIPDYSRLPYQTLKSLFKFRNALAHGKTETIEKTKRVKPDCDPYEQIPKPFWQEFCTEQNAEKVKRDLDKIIIELNVAAGHGEYPYINGMGFAEMPVV